ncbi:MAG: Bifunctional purine biosynthesis protein PurH [Myxococcota bacterium]|nr:Bifunctional purine biosynthesis protein PurH [Myxococcota bacterium]
MNNAPKQALISVSDKTGVVDFARELTQLGFHILSTGGTARALREAGIHVTDVSDYTGFPEILHGRVKTLHPKVAGGLLGVPSDPEHAAQMTKHGIPAIQIVAVNLYPFQQTIARPDASFADAIENIDIGGPTMLRAAAKNHGSVAVVTDPADYPVVIREWKEHGAVTAATRFLLARKVFAHTAAYDGAISNYLSARGPGGEKMEGHGESLHLSFQRVQELRYGENPHQTAAFYREPGRPSGLAAMEQLHGKELSYNNLLDIDSAWRLTLEFDAPTAVIIKHNNPCGAASAADITAAYVTARECDSVSAFGGVVGLNRVVTLDAAKELSSTFLEAIAAPDFEPAALELIEKKKNIRVIRMGQDTRAVPGQDYRRVMGGLLVQSWDSGRINPRECRVVTKRQPTEEEWKAMEFAWRVAKHVKSNAIVFATGAKTLGVGAGQMSRIDSTRIAVMKAPADQLKGCAAASDAFFPFRDGLDALAAAGARAVIQPGGSVRDEEVIAAADEHGIAMVFTGMRHFRH